MLENIELFGNSLGTGTYPDGEGKSFLQNIFDVIHPVGEVYIQYPAQKSPQEIYNKKDANNRIIIDSVWEEQLQYNSAFFRSEHLLGSYVYKANNETQYYLIDNLNNLTPINIAGNSSISIAGSPTAGQQKVIGDKTYQAYAVSGVNSSSSDYIKEGNPLSIQGNGNKSHNHNGSTGSESSHTHSLSSHTHSFSWSGSHTHGALSRNWSVETTNDCRPLTSSREAGFATPAVQQIQGDMTYVTTSKTGHYLLESKTISVSGTSGEPSNNTSGSGTSHSHSIGSDGITESRPDNFTYKIWKRIL